MNQPLVVLKFGSSVLADSSCLPTVVHEVYRYYRGGYQVLVVVSAIGRHTDLLLDEARHIATAMAPDTALAALLATGEQQSAALLTMAVNRAGIDCSLLDPASIGLTLSGDRLDASPVAVNIEQIRTAFSSTPVLVLPGYAGQHEQGGIALMGRGGSDLTAVFLAEQLDASDCRLVKDVDGIYERDPAAAGDQVPDERPHRYGTVTCEEALRVAEVLVQRKAIEYLQTTGNTVTVSALLHEDGTEVGAAMTTTADTTPGPPLRVLLLGLGVVGQGVYQHLQQLDQFFEVIGIWVRDIYKDRGCNVARTLLESDIGELMTRPHDLIVDVSGDQVAATTAAIENCLRAGFAAVTASKRLVADRGMVLTAMASKSGTDFKYSAAVGGSAPMIETLQRVLEQTAVTGLRGVLNGTCNYVLDRMAEGTPMEDAVVEAQTHGFAESDVARDLSGEDSGDKLRILARLAFGIECDGVPIRCEGLQSVTARELQSAKARGEIIRLVATFEPQGRASVRPEFLPADDFLAGAHREDNRLVISGAGGRLWQVSGKGAGRWPTAEAVIADMLDIHARAARRALPGAAREAPTPQPPGND